MNSDLTREESDPVQNESVVEESTEIISDQEIRDSDQKNWLSKNLLQ